MGGVCSKTNDDYDRPQTWVEVTEKSIYVAVFSHLFLCNVDAVKVIK